MPRPKLPVNVIKSGTCRFSVRLAPTLSSHFTAASKWNIVIDADVVSPSLLRNELCHEIGHAMVWQYFGTHHFSEADEERLANVFAEVFMTLVQENPRLIDWIQKV